jgi:hypothetical protein
MRLALNLLTISQDARQESVQMLCRPIVDFVASALAVSYRLAQPVFQACKGRPTTFSRKGLQL